MPAEDGTSCLVARAMPCVLPPPPSAALIDAKPELEPLTPDALADSLKKLSVQSTADTKSMHIKKPDLSPADFVQLQNIRSSALARKTNTTSKFGRDSGSLFDDLLLIKGDNTAEKSKVRLPKRETKEEVKKAEKQKQAEETEKVEKSQSKKPAKENDGEELLSRGPVRTSRPVMGFHPYGNGGYPSSNGSYEQPSPTEGLGHYDPQQPQWSVCREQLSNSSTPDSFHSDLGYSSSTSPPQPQCSRELTKAEIKGFLSGPCADNELPDALSDFILKYSRRYTNGPTSLFRTPNHSGNSSEAHSPVDMSPNLGARPSSVDSNIVCDSPMSAGSAPNASPARPHGGVTGPSTPQSGYRISHNMGELRSQLPSSLYARRAGLVDPIVRRAKEILRNQIQERDGDALDDAWAWTCKCQQYYPGALCYQDGDCDTLLHIVSQHMDLPKIYALVEQMLKSEYPSHEKPFDMKNRNGITPLFLAVEKRNNKVVDYLLEAGSNPNTQNSRYERDAALHYAAARGMTDITRTLCLYSVTNVNFHNGMGLSPLLCAVKNHGVFDEDTKTIVNNTSTIEMLLNFGADPMTTDDTNGRTAIHYAVDRLAPEIIDVFKNCLSEPVMTALVNRPDNNRETPLESIQSLTNVEDSVKQKLGLSLIMCGANSDRGEADDY